MTTTPSMKATVIVGDIEITKGKENNQRYKDLYTLFIDVKSKNQIVTVKTETYIRAKLNNIAFSLRTIISNQNVDRFTRSSSDAIHHFDMLNIFANISHITQLSTFINIWTWFIDEGIAHPSCKKLISYNSFTPFSLQIIRVEIFEKKRMWLCEHIASSWP